MQLFELAPVVSEMIELSAMHALTMRKFRLAVPFWNGGLPFGSRYAH
jgi:hypothetical protein